MNWRPLPLCAFLLSLTACLSAPEIKKPFAEFEFETPAFEALTVGIVHTNNTKETLKYAERFNKYNSIGILRSPRVEQYIHSVPDLLAKTFKSIVVYPSFEAARNANVDLIALMDATAVYSKVFQERTEADYRLMFVRPDRTQVVVLGGQHDMAPEDAPGFKMGPNKVPNAIRMVNNEALKKLRTAIRNSSELAAFQSEKKGMGAPRNTYTHSSAKRIASHVDTPDYRLPEDANSYALIIGIEGYKDLPAATFAEHDASAVRAHVEALGFPVRNTVYLTGAQASRSDIEKYVESWLPRNVKKDDRVFVYFSGHGAPDVSTGEAYLMPWNGDARFLENTGYPIKRLYTSLRKLPAKQVLVALDACFSGAGGRSVLAKGLRPLVTKIDLAEGEAQGLEILSASASDEVTGSIDSEGHGIFTYHLLSGLSGAAADATGRITSKSLFEYLKPKVRDDARRQNRDQTPHYQAPSQGEFLFRSK